MYWRTCSARKKKKLMTCSGCPWKRWRKSRVLRGNADRTGVQMALAHHDAADRDERRGCESELFGAEQRGDHDVATGLQLAVGLNANAAAQIVEQQHLLRFSQSELPRNASMLDRTQWRSAGSAAIAADEDDVGVSLGDACGNGADADFGHQLHRDARPRIHVLQVVDQLREIFDRIDVVMWRRRDQPDARDGMPQLRDDLVNFVARELAAFTGFRALRHLDLEFVGIDEVIRGHAEACRCDLLDRAAAKIAIRIGTETRFVLAAFTGVRLAADAIHRDGERLVRFLADGTE